MVGIKEEGLNTVVFVCIEEEGSPGVRTRVPRATAFLTFVRGDPFLAGYVVTASHVLEGIGNQTFYLRFNTQNGYDDIETSRDEWFIHDSADVALVRVQWSTYYTTLDPARAVHRCRLSASSWRDAHCWSDSTHKTGPGTSHPDRSRKRRVNYWSFCTTLWRQQELASGQGGDDRKYAFRTCGV